MPSVDGSDIAVFENLLKDFLFDLSDDKTAS